MTDIFHQSFINRLIIVSRGGTPSTNYGLIHFYDFMIPGPLVCEKDGRWHLVGTTSWGWGCGGQYYGVYTNIAELYKWIKENMK